jgi:Glycosyltransferase family 10 (fucosyltransferase) C-term
MRKNRIVLIFDTGVEKDHITPPIWEALLSGAVPAIYGASNAGQQHLPIATTSGSPAAVYATDFNSWDTFADYLKKISENQTLWESFHEWRNDTQAILAFETRYNFTRRSPNCRLCSWAYAKMYGLGWNHEQQSIPTATYIRREICLRSETITSSLTRFIRPSSVQQVVVHPFQERWITKGSILNDKTTGLHSGSNEDTVECVTNLIRTDATPLVVSGMKDTKITRSIYYHDGVTDLHLLKLDRSTTAADDDDDVVARIVLRLQFNVTNIDGAYFRNTHTTIQSSKGGYPIISSISIQDTKSKVTVLTNWETSITSPSAGIIDIPLGRQLFRRGQQHHAVTPKIRVITENMDTLHDKMTEYFPSYYGRRMMTDFMDPIRYYSSVP